MIGIVWTLIGLLCCGSDAKTHDPSARTSGPRTVAVTIDDLPVQHGGNLAWKKELTFNLLSALNKYGVPAIGFVNEQKLGEPDPVPEEVALLEAWLDAGLDLGNHTYSHPSLFSTPLEEFKSDFLRGQEVTSRLLDERGRTIRYFRHPFLNTGPDTETKTAFETFLEEHGYLVAPVTIDNDEWIYAFAYHKAHEAGDTLLAGRIGQDYVRYMNEMFEFYEGFSRELLGREPAQILLIHANKLNSDYFGALAEMMLHRGYQFVSLEEALQDSAYELPDEFVGRAGISWLQRWWLTEGREPNWGPEMAVWVRDLAFPDGI